MSNQSICHAILLLLQHGYRPVGQLRFYLNSWQSNPNPPGMLFLLHFPRMMPMPVFQREVHSIFYFDYRFHNARGGSGACQNPLLGMKRRDEGGKEEDVNKLRDVFKLYARTSPSFAAELLVALTFPAQ